MWTLQILDRILTDSSKFPTVGITGAQNSNFPQISPKWKFSAKNRPKFSDKKNFPEFSNSPKFRG